MSTNSKQSMDKRSSHLENFFKSTPKTQKRDSSNLSPLEDTKTQKKINRNEGNISMENPGLELNKVNNPDPAALNTSLKQIIGLLIEEVKALRETFHTDYNKLDQKLEIAIKVQKGEFTKLESTIATQKAEVTTTLTHKIEFNTTNINQLLEENRQLKKENENLQERITKIEIVQLGNNIILSGMPEQPWEAYKKQKKG